MRIVSLVPSVTETLTSWGRPPIACTRFCERPDLLAVGGTKDPDLRAIVALEPDLVIVDAEENRREDYEALVARGLSVHALHVDSLSGLDASMTLLATRVGAEWSPLSLGPPRPRRLRALVPIWRHPWMALGAPTYGAALLEHLGVSCLFSSEGRYPPFTLADATALQPDVVLAPSEPYPFTSRQLPELDGVAPTTLIDGKDLFWWGSRTSDAVERLADQIAKV